MTTSLWVLRILMFLPTTFRYRWLPGWKFLWLLIRWKDLLSLIDNLNFACQIIPAGRIFLCCFTDLSTTARLPHHHITMNLEACGDIPWWLKFLPTWNGRAIIPDPYWSKSPNWPSSQMHQVPLAVVWYLLMMVTRLPTPGQPSWGTTWYSGRSSTPLPFPAFCGDTCGQGRRFSSTVTISLWWISGPLVHPKTLISCNLITQYSSVVQLTILLS